MLYGTLAAIPSIAGVAAAMKYSPRFVKVCFDYSLLPTNARNSEHKCLTTFTTTST